MLEAHGYDPWGMHLGGRIFGGGKFKAPNPLKGFPDLFGVLRHRTGIMYAIECKTLKGDLSNDQIKWRARLRRQGVIVIVGRDPWQVLREIKAADRFPDVELGAHQ